MSDVFKAHEATQELLAVRRQRMRAEAVSPAGISGGFGLVVMNTGPPGPYSIQIEGVGEKLLIALNEQGARQLLQALIAVL
jgi:hypothetical protein